MQFAEVLVAEEGISGWSKTTGWLYYAYSCFMDKNYDKATFAIDRVVQRHLGEPIFNFVNYSIVASIRGRIIGQKMFNKKSGLHQLFATKRLVSTWTFYTNVEVFNLTYMLQV